MPNATELVRRAERKLGQIMAEQKLTVGFNKDGGDGSNQHGKSNRDSKKPGSSLPTLAEAGIDKNLAYRARAAAEGDDETFEDDLKYDLNEILNPPKTEEQWQDEQEEREARERIEHPEWFEPTDNVEDEDGEERTAAAPESKLVTMKSKEPKLAPSITDQCVEKVRAAVDNTVWQMERGGAPKAVSISASRKAVA